MGVDVGTENPFDARREFLERRPEQIAASHKVAEEASQRHMLSFPEAGRKALATAKLPTALRGDGLEGNITQAAAEGVQDSSVDGKDRAQRTLQSHIVFNSR
jgi:hypothetical protein